MLWTGGASCAVGYIGGDTAKGGEKLCWMAVPFLGGAACRGRGACSPLDLACSGCPSAPDVPPSEAREWAGEDKRVALEPRGREAGLWRLPPQLGRLLATGLGSTVLRSVALLTDFLGTSVCGRSRAFEAVRGSPTSAPPPRDRREIAGEGAPRVGSEESLHAPTFRAVLLEISGGFPLPIDSSAGGRSPFCPRGPSLVVPLTRPGIEIETGPGVLAGICAPLSTAGSLEAGLLGPVPVLRVGPTREVASRKVAVRMSPDLPARGTRPAAPRTRRAAGITGGGGRTDPGSLGVFRRPGEREAAVCAAAPALPLSLLSIPHLCLESPAPRRVVWGGAVRQHLSGRKQQTGEGEGVAGGGSGSRSAPRPTAGLSDWGRTRRIQTKEMRSALEGGAATSGCA